VLKALCGPQKAGVAIALYVRNRVLLVVFYLGSEVIQAIRADDQQKVGSMVAWNSISPSKSFSTVMASVGQFRLHQVQVQQRSFSISTLPSTLSLSTVRST
jgi:hypothetical protein